jgi:flagellar assembly protein FliH
VTPGGIYDDERTRPVAVRMTPLAYPELVKDETPEVRERARVQGHAAGYAAGRKAATETLANDRAALRSEADRALGVQIEGLRSALDAVRLAAGELNAQTAVALEGTEEAVLSAAIEIAGMILGRAISEDREGAAVAALRRALDAAGPVPIRVVRMHPDDLELVGMVAADEPGLQLLPDARIARGDAMVDLPDGVIDACIASAVERVRRALVGGEE